MRVMVCRFGLQGVLGNGGGPELWGFGAQPDRSIRTQTGVAGGVTIGSLRYWIFVTGRKSSATASRTTIKLAVPTKEKRVVAKTLGKTLVAVSPTAMQ